MEQQLPKIDITTFFLSISSAAMMGLGFPMGPEQEGSSEWSAERVDLEMARQNIDLLELMEERTKGNLSEEEKTLLERLLYELRVQFVEVQKKLN